MSVEHRVLLLSEEPNVQDRVRGALAANQRFGLADTCSSLSQVEDRLRRETVSAVLVDGGERPEQFFDPLETIIPEFPHTRFLIVSESLQNALVFEAMQIGARHIMTRESIDSQLGNVLQRLIPNGLPERSEQGHALLVLQAGGGCGATTVACNLAEELTQESTETALFVDLDWSYGGGSIYMGLEGEYGVADVLEHGQYMDGYLIRSSATHYSPSLHGLMSPAAVDFRGHRALSYDRLEELVSACRKAYAYSVFDVPRPPAPVTGSLAAASQLTLVVFELTVKSVRVARDIRARLLADEVPTKKVLLVANRYRWRTPVSLSEARRALGGGEIQLIRNHFKHAVKSMNRGRLLSEVAPRSKIRRDIQTMTGLIKTRVGQEVTPSQ